MGARGRELVASNVVLNSSPLSSTKPIRHFSPSKSRFVSVAHCRAILSAGILLPFG